MIILSALGTGAYREATYHFERREQTVRTGFFAAALAQWYPEARVVILATQGALNGPNGEHLARRLPNAEVVSIPNGSTEQECWDLFNAVAAAVPEGEEVIFDITHGLRHLPMLGFLVLSYLRVVKRVHIRRVLYGALELTPRDVPEGQEALTQVVDLTPLVTLLDWAQASERFLASGDASAYQGLLYDRQQFSLNAVGNKLKEFSDAMAYNRSTEAGLRAQELLEKIESSQSQAKALKHRPLEHVLQAIQDSVRPVAFLPTDPVVTLQAQHAQIWWYFERRHYAQALALAREWLVSVHTWHEAPDKPITMNKDLRALSESWLMERGRQLSFSEGNETQIISPDDPWAAFCKLTYELGDVRNDYAHFGMRPDPRSSRSAATYAGELIQRLTTIASQIGLTLEPA